MPNQYRASRMIRLRQGLAFALLILTGVVLFFWWHGRDNGRNQGKKVTPVGLTVRQTAHGFSLSQSEGGRPVFSLYADQAIQLQQGNRATLKNVRIDLYTQEGTRADQIYGQEFSYDPATGIVAAQGLVHIDLGGIPGQPNTVPSGAIPGEEAGRPIHIQTNDLTFNTRTGIGDVRKGLDFRYLGAQGSADSAHVTTHPDVLTLTGHVQLHWTRSAGPPVEVSSNTARLDKVAALIQLDGHTIVTDGPQHLSADRLQFLLRPDYSVRETIAVGHVNGTRHEVDRDLASRADEAEAFFAAPPASGRRRADNPARPPMQLASLRLNGHTELNETAPRQHNHLVAGSMALLFDKDGGLQQLQARQNASLRLVSTAESAPRQMTASKQKPWAEASRLLNLNGSAGSRSISAPELDFFLNPGKSGKTIHIRQLRSAGRAHLETHDPASWMTADADQFSLGFDAGQHPLQSEAWGNVLLKQQPAPVKGQAQPLRISHSDRLQLVFLPEQNRLKQAVQQGHVRLQQADRQIQADQVSYDAITGIAQIQAEANSPFTHGQVFGEDAMLRFRSPQARLDLNADRVQGWGGVQVSFLPGRSAPAASAQSGPLLNSRLPVNITADRMNVLEKSDEGEFKGHVRLWQGQNLILADTMNFDRSRGKVVAVGNVVSTFVQPSSRKDVVMPDILSGFPGPKAPASQKEPAAASPISITADRLDYSDLKHQGTYLGHVVLTSSQARLTARALQVDLSPAAARGGSAAGPAALQSATASGDVRITQPGREARADSVRYDMVENQITMWGGPPSIYDAEHGYLTGETLTFSPSNDTIRVESQPGKRTFGEYRVKH